MAILLKIFSMVSLIAGLLKIKDATKISSPQKAGTLSASKMNDLVASRRGMKLTGGNKMRFKWVRIGCVAILLVLIGWGLAWAEPSQGEKLGCHECHRFSAEDPNPARKGPDLHYAGDKFQSDWLLQFLQNPKIIRKTRVTSDQKLLIIDGEKNKPHPKLGPQSAKEMAEYLSSLKIPGLATGLVDTEPLSKGTRVKVKILFERNLSCIACHEGINLAGKPRGGISGPSLATAGNRLNADWLFHYLKTPEKFVTENRMPRYQLDDETLGFLSRYIMSLKLQETP